MEVALVPLDDLYQTSIPESEWPRRSVAERLARVFDWDRVRRDAIEPLRRGEPGRWRAFDFVRGLGEGGTYRLKNEATEIAPSPTILLEGAYSASPPLRDLIDLAVLVQVPIGVRHHRIAAREAGGDESATDWIFDWHAIWDDVETYYFESVCPPASFDLVIPNDDRAILTTR